MSFQISYFNETSQECDEDEENSGLQDWQAHPYKPKYLFPKKDKPPQQQSRLDRAVFSTCDRKRVRSCF